MSGDENRNAPGTSPLADRVAPLPISALGLAVTRIRRDPIRLVPFAVVGVLITGIDLLRRQDSVPVIELKPTGDVLVLVEHTLYPTGRPQTIRALDSLVDLELPYLGWALGLEVVSIVAIAAAGVVVMGRALDDSAWVAVGDGPNSLDRLVPYLGFVVAADLVGRLIGWVGLFWGIHPFVGVALLVVVFFVLVRLFLTPVLIVAGRSPIEAVRRSVRLTRGCSWTVFGLVIFFGLGTWSLASVQVVGTTLTFLVFAPLQAVTLVVLLEYLSTAGDRSGPGRRARRVANNSPTR